jgi:signal recognition particle subunit SRP54
LRIANGSGTSTTEVNNLLKQFKEMQKMMRSFGPMARLVNGKSKKGGPRKPRGGGKSRGGRATPSRRGGR